MYRGQHSYLRGTVFTRRNNFINFSPGFVSLKPGFHLKPKILCSCSTTTLRCSDRKNGME